LEAVQIKTSQIQKSVGKSKIAIQKIQIENAVITASFETGVCLDGRRCRFGQAGDLRSITFDGSKFRPARSSESGASIDLSDGATAGSMSFQRTTLEHGTDISLDETTFDGDLDLRNARFGGRFSSTKSQFRGEVALSAAHFSQAPDFQQSNFRFPPALSHAQDLGFASRSIPYGSGPDVARRFAHLRRIASAAHDKKLAHELMVGELRAIGGAASQWYGTICDYGLSWARPALALIVLTIFVFPTAYYCLAAINNESGSSAGRFAYANTTDCSPVDGYSATIAASLELSLRTAMFISPSDNRVEAARSCLLPGQTIGLSWSILATLELIQIILTVAFTFVIGVVVTTRLQMK
jgi:hypothetical protein